MQSCRSQPLYSAVLRLLGPPRGGVVVPLAVRPQHRRVSAFWRRGAGHLRRTQAGSWLVAYDFTRGEQTLNVERPTRATSAFLPKLHCS